MSFSEIGSSCAQTLMWNQDFSYACPDTFCVVSFLGGTAMLEPERLREECVRMFCVFVFVFVLSCGLALPSETNLGHVVSGACCTIQTSDLHMAVTKVFIRMNVSDLGLLN